MKTILLSLSVLLSTALLSDELSWVDEQVQAIKPPRSGMKHKAISSLRSPFIFLAKNRGEDVKNGVKKKSPQVASLSSTATKAPKQAKSVKKVFTLGLVMNSSAMINEKWHRVGDIINGYTVKEMSTNSVLLVKNKKQLLLSTKSNAKTIKFKN